MSDEKEVWVTNEAGTIFFRKSDYEKLVEIYRKEQEEFERALLWGNSSTVVPPDAIHWATEEDIKRAFPNK